MNDSKHVFVAVAATILVGLGASILRQTARRAGAYRPVHYGSERTREATGERCNDTVLPPSR